MAIPGFSGVLGGFREPATGVTNSTKSSSRFSLTQELRFWIPQMDRGDFLRVFAVHVSCCRCFTMLFPRLFRSLPFFLLVSSVLLSCVPATGAPGALKSVQEANNEWQSGWSFDFRVYEKNCAPGADGQPRIAGTSAKAYRYEFRFEAPRDGQAVHQKPADTVVYVERYLPKGYPLPRRLDDLSSDAFRVYQRENLEYDGTDQAYVDAEGAFWERPCSGTEFAGNGSYHRPALADFGGTPDAKGLSPDAALSATSLVVNRIRSVLGLGKMDRAALRDTAAHKAVLEVIQKRPSETTALQKIRPSLWTSMWLTSHRWLNADKGNETWEYQKVPGMVCQDDPSGRNSGVLLNFADADDWDGTWVVYLSGGGACFNPATCKAWLVGLYGQHESFTESDSRDTASKLGTASMFDRGDYDNPFSDAHFVYVPYCTGDIFFGDNPHGDYPFAGYHNISRVLDRVVPTAFGMGLDGVSAIRMRGHAAQKTTQVVLAGNSAGGLGAMLNYPRTVDAFAASLNPLLKHPANKVQLSSKILVHLVNDGGAQVARKTARGDTGKEVFTDCLQQKMYEAWNLQEHLPDAFLRRDQKKLVDGYVKTSRGIFPALSNFAHFVADHYAPGGGGNPRHLNLRQAYITSKHDWVMRTFLGQGLHDCGEQDFDSADDQQHATTENAFASFKNMVRSVPEDDFKDGLAHMFDWIDDANDGASQYRYFVIPGDDHVVTIDQFPYVQAKDSHGMAVGLGEWLESMLLTTDTFLYDTSKREYSQEEWDHAAYEIRGGQ